MLEHLKPSERSHADKYDSDWHDFTSTYLPDTLFIQDIDSVIRDKEGNIMFLEIKRFCAPLKPFQRYTAAIFYSVFNTALKASKGFITISILGKKSRQRVKFRGYHLLQLSNSSFINSTFYLDGKEISKEELIIFLSFKA